MLNFHKISVNDEYYLLIDPYTKFWALIEKKNYNRSIDKIIEKYKNIRTKLIKNLNFWRKVRSEPLIIHFEIHPTGRCNLNCKYCYIMQTSDNPYKDKDMDKETMEEIFSKIIYYVKEKNINKVTITFHGGESLLKKDLIIEAVDKYYKDSRFVFDIQTNGTLLNEELVEYFYKRNVKIGISIDGPPNINDITRVYPNGRGTYNRIKASINLLRKYYKRLGGIVTVTRYNVNYLDLIVEHLYELGFYSFFMNPVIPSKKSLFQLVPQVTSLIEGYKRAINKVIEINTKSQRKVYISNISALLMNIFTDDQPCTCYETPCGAARTMLVIAPNGDVYPCSEFVINPEFKLGNLLKDSIDKILNNKMAILLRNRTVDSIEKCSKCPFKYICGGNCPFSSLIKHGSLYREPLYCDFYYSIIIYLFSLISKYDKKIIELLVEGRDRKILAKRELLYDLGEDL